MLTSVCDTINQTFLKSAINSLNGSPKPNLPDILRFIGRVIIVPRVWLSGIFAMVSLGIWLLVLSGADLNFAFSADSIHYIFIALASKTFLKEKVSPSRWLGIASIILGIVLISLN